jgi:hypothetical protein
MTPEMPTMTPHKSICERCSCCESYHHFAGVLFEIPETVPTCLFIDVTEDEYRILDEINVAEYHMPQVLARQLNLDIDRCPFYLENFLLNETKSNV